MNGYRPCFSLCCLLIVFWLVYCCLGYLHWLRWFRSVAVGHHSLRLACLHKSDLEAFARLKSYYLLYEVPREFMTVACTCQESTNQFALGYSLMSRYWMCLYWLLLLIPILFDSSFTWFRSFGRLWFACRLFWALPTDRKTWVAFHTTP